MLPSHVHPIFNHLNQLKLSIRLSSTQVNRNTKRRPISNSPASKMSFSLFSRRAVTGVRAFSTSSPRPIARITIIGNLADTPELVGTQTGREIVRYAVASNSGPADNRQTSWFRVTSFTEGPSRDYLLSLPKG